MRSAAAVAVLVFTVTAASACSGAGADPARTRGQLTKSSSTPTMTGTAAQAQGTTGSPTPPSLSRVSTVSAWPGVRTDPAAFREVFGRAEVYSTVQHSSRAVAVANIQGCGYDPSRCQHAVLLTTDRWAHQTGVVVDSDDAFGVEVHVLPEGAVAVVGAQRGDRPVRPFILHASGVITALKLSTEPGAPAPGAVLVPRPPNT